MTKRSKISASDLYVRMEREFRRRRPRECAVCAMTLPFRVDAGGTDAPNWEVVPPSDCPKGCSLLLEEIVAEHRDQYLLADENGRGK